MKKRKSKLLILIFSHAFENQLRLVCRPGFYLRISQCLCSHERTLTKWILTANPLNYFHTEVLSSIWSSVWTSVPPLYPDVELFSTSRLQAGAAITLQGWCWNSHDTSSFTTIMSSHVTLTIQSHIRYDITIIGKLKLRGACYTQKVVYGADSLHR